MREEWKLTTSKTTCIAVFASLLLLDRNEEPIEYECEIQLRFKPLTGPVAFHAYIVLYTFRKGINMEDPYPSRFRAGPSNHGFLRGHSAVYQEGDIDWGVDHPFISTGRLPGPCSVYAIIFQRRTTSINDRGLLYLLITQNSNAYAYTLLLAFELVKDYFTDDAITRAIGGVNRIPGWGQDLMP
jgi:hypothetical protein